MSIEEGASASIVVSPWSGPMPTSVMYEFSRVDPDYTEFFQASSMTTLTLRDGKLRISTGPVEQLPTGMYQLTGLTIEHDAHREVLTPSDFGVCLFEVRQKGARNSRTRELRARFDRYERLRAKEFRSGIGTGEQWFLVLVFVKDLMLTRRMRLGRFEVIPYAGLQCNDELEVMNSFLEECGFGKLQNTGPALRQATQSQPTAVFHFPVVYGSSVDDAFDSAAAETDLAVAILALDRGSTGVNFGAFAIQDGSGNTWFRLNTPHYMGNLMGGPIGGGEIPGFIRRRIDRIRESPRSRLHVMLYKEARTERDPEFRMLRYWNLLETVARSMDYVGAPKLSFDGGVVQNRRGATSKVQDHAEDLVKQLILAVLGIGSRGLAAVGSHTLEDQVSIWYQRRNCLVHGGDCLCRGDKVPNAKVKVQSCFAVRNAHATEPFDPVLSTIERVADYLMHSLLQDAADGG